jgi:copper resistance protein B
VVWSTAPYFVETDAELIYILMDKSNDLGANYEWRLTQRWVVIPEVEA